MWQNAGLAADQLPAGSWDTRLFALPLGKGGAVKAAVSTLGATEPFVVVDADLHRLEPRVVARAAEEAAAGYVARPSYEAGAGRLGRRLWRVMCGLEVLPDEWMLRGDLRGLEHGGVLSPLAGYPNALHVLSTPENGMAFDLDVLLRSLFAGLPLGLFAAGERAHRPGPPAALTDALEEHLRCLAGWVRW